MVVTVHELDSRGRRMKQPRMPGTTAIPVWRWFALLAIVAVFAADNLVDSSLEAQLTAAGGALVPVHSAFAAWTVILVALGGYGVVQLVEDQRRVAAYDRASHLVVLACALLGTQLAIAGANPIATGVTALVIAVVSATAYVKVQRAILSNREPQPPSWIGLPLALLTGFTTVVAIVAIQSAIPHAGNATAIALVITATVVVVALAIELRDATLPGFTAWLFVSICAATDGNAALATSTLLAGGACAAIAIFLAATRLGAVSAETNRRLV
ncbi:MAG: hypothetical protein ABI867_04485 [Kofleriaceae bacterium]